MIRPLRQFNVILTVFKSCINQVLGTLEQLLPALLHQLLDPGPVSKAEILNPLVVPGGPPVALDKDKADKEEEEMD